MKKLLLITYYLLLITYCKSQNLIPNPSFENITGCPFGTNAIYAALPWFQPATFQGNTTNSCNSDLYDTCSDSYSVGIPLNFLGYQRARTGHGYAGFIFNSDTLNGREYIEVPLLDTLKANKKYCVQFYVSLADSSQEAISNIGAYFSNDSLLDNRFAYLTINYVTPQIENPVSNIISDTANWVLVSGNFIANGGERFMTIGNFHLPANTNSINVANTTIHNAYYYIDDVSVIYCDPSGVGEYKDDFYCKLYPNPNNGNMIIEYHLKDTESGIVSIYDLTGRVEKAISINSKNTTLQINESELNAGTYYYSIMVNNNKVKTEKLIIIK